MSAAYTYGLKLAFNLRDLGQFAVRHPMITGAAVGAPVYAGMQALENRRGNKETQQSPINAALGGAISGAGIGYLLPALYEGGRAGAAAGVGTFRALRNHFRNRPYMASAPLGLPGG